MHCSVATNRTTSTTRSLDVIGYEMTIKSVKREVGLVLYRLLYLTVVVGLETERKWGRKLES